MENIKSVIENNAKIESSFAIMLERTKALKKQAEDNNSKASLLSLQLSSEICKIADGQ